MMGYGGSTFTQQHLLNDCGCKAFEISSFGLSPLLSPDLFIRRLGSVRRDDYIC